MALIDKAREELADHAVEALSVAGLVVVWQLLALAVANPLKLPSFLEVAEALLRQWETILWVDLPVSLIHFAIGMTAGLLLALPIGMAMGWSRIADRIFDPIVELIRPSRPSPGSPLPSSGLDSPPRRRGSSSS